MLKSEFTPTGLKLLDKSDIVRENDYYWSVQRVWLPVPDQMVGFPNKRYTVARKE